MTQHNQFPRREADRARAIEMRQAGAEYARIAREFGIGEATAFRWCNPKNYAQYQKTRPPRYTKNNWIVGERRCTREEITARLAEIPVDTRDLTATLFGDPLPGRSYLDRMKQS